MPAVAGSILTGAANPAPIRHLIVSTWGMFVFVCFFFKEVQENDYLLQV